MKNSVYEKHNIKRADRLIGNTRLNKERSQIHRILTDMIINREKHPVILIDWSRLSSNGHYHVLRASVPVGGRALTVHPEKLLSNSKIEKKFYLI